MGMGYERKKLQPWEKYTDGEWHAVRCGPPDEPREESMRIYHNHAMSMRQWADRNGYRGQLSRRGNGRELRVRFTPITRPMAMPALSRMDRTQLGTTLVEALKLIHVAVRLRTYGEPVPGDPDVVWDEFDRGAGVLLRRISQ